MSSDAGPAIGYRWLGGKLRLSFPSEMSAEYCYHQRIRKQPGTSEPSLDGIPFPLSTTVLIDPSLLGGVSKSVCLCACS